MIHYLYLLRAMVGSIYSAVGLLRRRNTRTGHHSSLLLHTVANRSKPLPFRQLFAQLQTAYTAPHPRFGSHGKSDIPRILVEPPATLPVHRFDLPEGCEDVRVEEDTGRTLENAVYAPSAINKPKAFCEKKESGEIKKGWLSLPIGTKDELLYSLPRRPKMHIARTRTTRNCFSSKLNPNTSRRSDVEGDNQE
jgi:hypothetical protein